MEAKKIRILSVNVPAWADNNSLGNTLSNFFGDIDSIEFCNLYCREEMPQNSVCTEYFNITETQLVKNLFNSKNIGHEFTITDLAAQKDSESYRKAENREKKLLDLFRSMNTTVFIIARELLWKLGGWKNKKLDDFLTRGKIDIIFSLAANPIYLEKMVDYCKRKSGAKLVLFFADDTYSHKSRMPLAYLYRSSLRKAIRHTVESADKLYGASQKLCDEYTQYFNKKIEPLYKGCSFDQYEIKETVAKPIKIVYAGNLYWGRWEILGALANEIEKINGNTVKITLEVYSTATVTPELDKALNIGQSSKIMGAKPYEEIKTILANADIVLYVESFEKKEIKTTRLSFSTKIIDCMQSGSCMMAIGPACVASIEYLKRLDGAIVITDLTNIGETLQRILQDNDIVRNKAKLLRDYAREHHNIDRVRNKLKSDFEQLAGNEINI